VKSLFFILLVVSILLGYIDGVFIPSREEHAKTLMDMYVKEISAGNVNDRQYEGVITLSPLKCRIENLEISSGNGSWDGIVYSDVGLKIDKINFDPVAMLWHEKIKLVSIGKMEFHAVTSFVEFGNKLTLVNTDLKDISIRYDGGHTYLDGYFEPLKSRFEFDGDFIISPTGDVKYRIKKATNESGEVIHSRETMNLIEEKSILALTINVLDRAIKIDKLEVNESGINLTGKSD
jgi:hypothetical protein